MLGTAGTKKTPTLENCSHPAYVSRMLEPDHINGLFELVGGIFIWLNVRRIYIDKTLKGVSALPTIFFTSWGFWNLYYYPHLEQWFSFLGGVFIVIANCVWLYFVAYYWRKGKNARTEKSTALQPG